MGHPACKEFKQLHLLNEAQVPAWGLFKTIRPIFVSSGCKWKVKDEEKTFEQNRPLWLKGRNALGGFKDELRKLPVSAVQEDLECNIWENCITTLSEVLSLLDSIVKEDIILEKRAQVHGISKVSLLIFSPTMIDPAISFRRYPKSYFLNLLLGQSIGLSIGFGFHLEFSSKSDHEHLGIRTASSGQ